MPPSNCPGTDVTPATPAFDNNSPTATTTTTIGGLARRLGDLEVPVAGTWSVVPTSYVAIVLTGRRDHPVQLRILGGAFAIEEHPAHSELRLSLDGADGMTFVGQPTEVRADLHGLSQWSITGTLTGDDRTVPMALTISYHGVYRSRGRAWAWFSGTGDLQVPRTRSWGRMSSDFERRIVVVDLLFDSPPTAPPRGGESSIEAAA